MKDGKTHYMLDLETFGLGRDAAIASIGCVLFNPYDSTVPIRTGLSEEEFKAAVRDRTPTEDLRFGNTFSVVVALDKSSSPGNLTPSTVYWWLRQPEQAQRILLDGKATLHDTLVQFKRWIEEDGKASPSDRCLWSNGPTFDEMILRDAFERHNIGPSFPFHYRSSRCMRTLSALAETAGWTPPQDASFIGVKHSAIDDAVRQVRIVQSIHAWLFPHSTGGR